MQEPIRWELKLKTINERAIRAEKDIDGGVCSCQNIFMKKSRSNDDAKRGKDKIQRELYKAALQIM